VRDHDDVVAAQVVRRGGGDQSGQVVAGADLRQTGERDDRVAAQWAGPKVAPGIGEWLDAARRVQTPPKPAVLTDLST
jgi:hypothetical protein